MGDKKNITIGDVAEALGVSKSTVSRSISGKGRVGEATRNQVLKYIEEHNYVPNALAKGLASQRTYNVGLLVPEDFAAGELPFFQKCLMGICEAAHEQDYNVLISITDSDDNALLERLIDNRKIDGVLLSRTQPDDAKVLLLKEREVPFVTIGSYEDPDVVQVDNDNEQASYELTREIIKHGASSLALISSADSYVVTEERRKGFLRAVDECKTVSYDVFMDGNNMGQTLDRIMQDGYECIVCMDDMLCSKAVEMLKDRGRIVPGDIKIASFYGAPQLDKYNPPITSVRFDSRELGKKACRTLLEVIDGREYNDKTLMDFEVNITESI